MTYPVLILHTMRPLSVFALSMFVVLYNSETRGSAAVYLLFGSISRQPISSPHYCSLHVPLPHLTVSPHISLVTVPSMDASSCLSPTMPSPYHAWAPLCHPRIMHQPRSCTQNPGPYAAGDKEQSSLNCDPTLRGCHHHRPPCLEYFSLFPQGQLLLVPF